MASGYIINEKNDEAALLKDNMRTSYVFSLKSFYIYYINAFVMIFAFMAFFVFAMLGFFYAGWQFFEARIPDKVFEVLLMLFSANAALSIFAVMLKKFLKERKDIIRPKQLILEDNYFFYKDDKGRGHTVNWPDVKSVKITMMKMGYRAKVTVGDYNFVFFSYEFEEIPDDYKAAMKVSFSSGIFMDILKVFRQNAENAVWKKDFFLRFRKLSFE